MDDKLEKDQSSNKYSPIVANLRKESVNVHEMIQPFLEWSSEWNQKVSELLKLVNNAMAPFRDSLEMFEKQRELWSKPFEDISNLFKKLAPKLITREQYEVYVSNARQYGKSGWGIHPDLPHNIIILDYNQARILIQDCIENVDQSTDICFRAIKEEIEPAYASIIDEAFICFENQCYRACCSLLISQIDRIFQSFLYRLYGCRAIYSKNVRADIDQKINEDYNINEHDISELLLWISLQEVFNTIYDSINFENYSAAFDSKRINRHCIQHGYSLHTFSKCDCLQVSTILYSVINMTTRWDMLRIKSLNFMGILVEKNDVSD